MRIPYSATENYNRKLTDNITEHYNKWNAAFGPLPVIWTWNSEKCSQGTYLRLDDVPCEEHDNCHRMFIVLIRRGGYAQCDTTCLTEVRELYTDGLARATKRGENGIGNSQALAHNGSVEYYYRLKSTRIPKSLHGVHLYNHPRNSVIVDRGTDYAKFTHGIRAVGFSNPDNRSNPSRVGWFVESCFEQETLHNYKQEHLDFNSVPAPRDNITLAERIVKAESNVEKARRALRNAHAELNSADKLQKSVMKAEEEARKKREQAAQAEKKAKEAAHAASLAAKAATLAETKEATARASANATEKKTESSSTSPEEAFEAHLEKELQTIAAEAKAKKERVSYNSDTSEPREDLPQIGWKGFVKLGILLGMPLLMLGAGMLIKSC